MGGAAVTLADPNAFDARSEPGYPRRVEFKIRAEVRKRPRKWNFTKGSPPRKRRLFPCCLPELLLKKSDSPKTVQGRRPPPVTHPITGSLAGWQNLVALRLQAETHL